MCIQVHMSKKHTHKQIAQYSVKLKYVCNLMVTHEKQSDMVEINNGGE